MPDKTFTIALSDIRCVRCEVNKYRKKVFKYEITETKKNFEIFKANINEELTQFKVTIKSVEESQ